TTTSGHAILTNTHVLARYTPSNPTELAVTPKDTVIQPGPLDGGASPGDHLATVSRGEPVRLGPGRQNWVDAAIAEIDDQFKAVLPFIFGIGEIRSCVDLSTLPDYGFGLRVRKMGRTTHLTFGVIDSVGTRVTGVSYPQGGSADFVDQIV